jgi:hypothetical protein
LRCGWLAPDLSELLQTSHFKYTIHEPLSTSQKRLVADYLRGKGFYSYDAADEVDDPVKRWIGREVKRFLHEADLHLPFLLRLACGQIDLSDDGSLNAAGEEQMDVSGGMFAPSDDEIEEESERPSLIMETSDYWDNFLSSVKEIEQPWLEDSDAYRRNRALLYCNAARCCYVVARVICTL